LGHVSFGYLKKLFEKYDTLSFKCDVYELAKSHRASFPLSLNRSSVPFMVIHSHVRGPFKVPTLSGSWWFVTFIDDYRRVTWVCLMKSKGDVNVLFQQFHKMMSTQYNAKIQVLRSENGGEYMGCELQQYWRTHGIIHQATYPYTP